MTETEQKIEVLQLAYDLLKSEKNGRLKIKDPFREKGKVVFDMNCYLLADKAHCGTSCCAAGFLMIRKATPHQLKLFSDPQASHAYFWISRRHPDLSFDFLYNSGHSSDVSEFVKRALHHADHSREYFDGTCFHEACEAYEKYPDERLKLFALLRKKSKTLQANESHD